MRARGTCDAKPNVVALRANKLAKYRDKRDFARSPEPSGARAVGNRHGFVIQQHAARRMHYDFRLEHGGVLWSWSVPKGPSLDPGERRLAVRTEDHPLDYADFEGVIPPGQYGSGTVIVWDRGTWQPHGDADDALARGRITFELVGEKLHGRWHLVRTKNPGKQETWLLFKGRDTAANDELDIVAGRPESVASGRTIAEVAAHPQREWRSNRGGAASPPSPSSSPPPSPSLATQSVAELVAQLPVGFALTNLDKVLYPDQGLTKAQLVAYLAVIAERMLPHAGGRPLTLLRCPEGTRKPCFYQRHVLAGSPDAIVRVASADDGGDGGDGGDTMTIHDMPGLVALAQLGALEIHTWGCHADELERPDLLVFDLDPDVGLAWDRVALGAFELRAALADLGLESFVKTTGGKGLHVVAPIARGPSWDDFKTFSKHVAERLERAHPERYVTNMAKARRKNKIFIDYLRNGRGASAIAPYSPRARGGGPVATPLEWEDLAAALDPAAFTIQTIPQHVATHPDPWQRLRALDQRLSPAMLRAAARR